MKSTKKITSFFVTMILFLTSMALVSAQEVTKKSRVVRGSDYIESVFYVGDKEVAREKTSNQGTYDQEGEIPGGKVMFFNETSKTHGEEYYNNGKKDGLSKIFYENGQLKNESQYKNGILLNEKEYYNDGQLRFEGNYEDARDYADNKEVGIGKLYFKNGILKYEWNFTKSENIAFRKSYNQNGELVYEARYDGDGKLIEEHKGNQSHDMAQP